MHVQLSVFQFTAVKIDVKLTFVVLVNTDTCISQPSIGLAVGIVGWQSAFC